MIDIQNETIKGMVDGLKRDIMDAIYNDNMNDEESDMDIIVRINGRIDDILTEVSTLEARVDTRTRMYKYWEKQYKDLKKELEEAGISVES